MGIKGADCGLKFLFFFFFPFLGVVLEIAEDFIYIFYCYCSVSTPRFMQKPYLYCSCCGVGATLACSELKLVPWFWFSSVCGLFIVELNTTCKDTKHNLFCWCKMKTWKPIALDVGLKC